MLCLLYCTYCILNGMHSAQNAHCILFISHHIALCCVCVTWCVSTTASAVCYVSLVSCLHYCQRSVLSKSCLFCVCITASVVYYVSPVVSLHYCQRRMLLLSTTSAVCCVGATISPLFKFIFNLFYYFYPFPLVGSE